MKMKRKLPFLALAVSIASASHAAQVVVTANSPTYVDLDTGTVVSNKADAEIYLDKGTVVGITPTAYTGEHGENGFDNIIQASDYNLLDLKGNSRKRVKNPNFPAITRNADGDSLDTWNKNWWGKVLVGWGIGGGNIKAVGDNKLDSPFGNQFYGAPSVVENAKKGLLFNRKLKNQEGDVVALPFNQLIVRTSEGNKFVRLRAISVGDPASETGTTLRNWASNNVYFKYAVAGADGQFGTEKEMCVSLSTDSRTDGPRSVATTNPIDNNTKTFGYTLADTDKWYKQQFIDFDTIVNADDAADANGIKPKTVASDGTVDITPYAPALNRGYAEPCLAAWNNARPSEYYPSLYQNGFTFVGADTPISSRRADWMDNDNSTVTNDYNGNDEWDLAINFMAAPANFGDLISRNYEVYTEFRVNNGLIGNSAESVRTKPGYAAAVMVAGVSTNDPAQSGIDKAEGYPSDSNQTGMVEDIDTFVMPNGKTVRESLQANGKSVTEQYTTFGVDESTGVITSNKRVFITKPKNSELWDPSKKYRVISYDPSTFEYIIEYDDVY